MWQPKDTFCPQETVCNERWVFLRIQIVAALGEKTKNKNKHQQPTVLFLTNQRGNDTKKLYKHGWCQLLQQPQAHVCHLISWITPPTKTHLYNNWLLIFRRKGVYICEGLAMGGFIKYEICSFPLPAFLSSHWTRSLLSLPMSSVRSLSLCYRASTSSLTQFPHTLHQEKVVFPLKITPSGTPCKKAVELPLFVNNICTYSNSWLIKKVSVDRCQEYMA